MSLSSWRGRGQHCYTSCSLKKKIFLTGFISSVFLVALLKQPGNHRTPFTGSGLTMLPIERGEPAINLVALGHL